MHTWPVSGLARRHRRHTSHMSPASLVEYVGAQLTTGQEPWPALPTTHDAVTTRSNCNQQYLLVACIAAAGENHRAERRTRSKSIQAVGEPQQTHRHWTPDAKNKTQALRACQGREESSPACIEAGSHITLQTTPARALHASGDAGRRPKQHTPSHPPHFTPHPASLAHTT
jgi:hypothetical protein